MFFVLGTSPLERMLVDKERSYYHILWTAVVAERT